MGDSRAGGGAGDGATGRDGDPLTLEQLISRQGAGPSGRRAARRTGSVPIPLVPGESLPAHRGPRPAVPPAGARPLDRGPAPGRATPAAPVESPPPLRGFPPVPAGVGAAAVRPAAPTAPPVPPPAAAVARTAAPPSPPVPAPTPAPAVPAPDGGVRYSQPVPPLPGGGPAVLRSGPVPPMSGVRHSQPVPPLPGGGPAALQPPSRRGNPLPPIPGLDAPGRSGATAAPRPPRRESRAARRAARSPGRRRMVRLAQGVAALVALVLAYHLGLYVYVDNGIDRVDALTVDGPEIIAPGLQEGAATYLVVGTGLPGDEGPGGVAALLARVAPDEESAVLVSLPPTALVDTPACRDADGDQREPVTEAFGDSLLRGGPACMVRAVQQLSGLRVDHYLGVDLARLPAMVDALDGIPVCLPTVTDAWAAAADPLPAGASDLDGDRAASWLRPGDAAGDPSGTAVAERAQVLLTSTLRQAMSLGVLGNPVRLTSFLTTAADALTVDDDTNLGDLRTLAGTLGDLSGDAVQRAALPVAAVGYVPAGTDESYVLLDRAATRELFETVLEDDRLPDSVVGSDDAAAAAAPVADTAAPAEPQAAAPAAPAAAAAPTVVPPSAVTLDVLNGTATAGLAGTVAEQLRAQGFTVGSVGNEAGGVDGTVVRHGPDVLAEAQTVAAAVPGAVLEASDSLAGTVQLVVGPDFDSVVPVPAPAPQPAPEATAAGAPAAQPSADALPAADAETASASVSCG